jgi:hypothetical protein
LAKPSKVPPDDGDWMQSPKYLFWIKDRTTEMSKIMIILLIYNYHKLIDSINLLSS